MGETGLGKRVARSMLWSFGENFVAAAVGIVATVILARLVEPFEFGLIAVLEVFVMTGLLFVESGFSSALIRLRERTRQQEQTALACNLIAAALLYSALFVCAPLIADLYSMPRLTAVTRVFCLVLPLNALCIVQQARLTASLRFGTLFMCTITASVVSTVVAVIMACFGFGVWALVMQQLSMWGVRCVMLWAVQWRKPVVPKFNRKAFGELFGFGWKLLVASIVDKVSTGLYSLVIGKCFGVYHAGLFSKARSLAAFPAENATAAMQRVSYPALSKITDEKERLSRSSRLLVEVAEWFVFPAMCLVAALSPQVVSLLLGDKWIAAAPYLSVICIGYALYPIHAINLNILNACGRSDLFLRLELIKVPIAVSVMILGGLFYGIMGLCLAFAINSVICLFVNGFYSKRLASLPISSQLLSLIPIVICSVVASVVAYFVASYVDVVWLSFIIGVATGAACYLCISFVIVRRVSRDALNFFKLILR